jgi:hypothetical protein
MNASRIESGAPAGILAVGADRAHLAVAILHAIVLVAIGSLDPRGPFAVLAAMIVAFGIVYTSNTVAHWHIHRPLFRSRVASRTLSLALTLVTFVPQTMWTQRHLWHHAGEPNRPAVRFNARLAIEIAMLAMLAFVLAWLRLHFLLFVLVPGFLGGMLLCTLQGHFEHAAAEGGVSHYGWLYNALFFNDGFHAEHHASPRVHWSELAARPDLAERTSTHAPLLRWLEHVRTPGVPRAIVLGLLERTVFVSGVLQRWVVEQHARALAGVLADVGPLHRIAVVGGGLFPRTVFVLRAIAPHAQVVVIDASQANLDVARRMLDAHGVPCPRLLHASFDPEAHAGFDLVVFPLAFVGGRALVDGARAANRHVVTHDWLVGGTRGVAQRTVSLWLWKRVTRHSGAA